MKKILSLVLALVMVLMMVPMTVNAETTGFTGGCTWKLKDDGLLIISGTGAIGSSAAFGEHADAIQSVVIEEGVTKIGGSAFGGCSNLTSVTIPGSVTSIGNYAFSGCSSLKSVTIPGSVKSIGNSAFSGCSKLTAVTIPGSVTIIGSSAFSGCSSLVTVRYEGTTEPLVGNYAFRGCLLNKVYVPTGYLEDTFGGLGVNKTLDVTPPDKPTYTVTVTDGTADKEKYEEGETVTIAANAAEEGMQFAGWTSEDGVEFEDANAEETTFTMPAKDVSVTATFIAQHVCGNGELQPGQAATCEADGWNDYYQCSCGELYENEACTKPIENLEAWKTDAGKIATEGHDYGELIPAKDAVHTQTLLSAAVDAHYYCEVCDTYFVDGDEGTKVKTTLSELTGEMPAHDTEAWVNTDKEQHWKKCSVCGLEDMTTAAAHDFDNDSDTTCNTCGYVRTVSGGATGDTPGAQRPAYPTYWPVVDETTTGAAAEDHFMVLCRKLNVRAGAGTAFAKVGSLVRGAMVHGKALDNGWIQIEYEGKTAYISAQYAELLEDAACEKTVTVICRKLNVRTGAGTNYSKVGSVMRGDELCVVSGKDGWYEVLYEDGTAWVSAQYVA